MNSHLTTLQILFGKYYLGIIILIIMVFLKDDMIVSIFRIIVGFLLTSIIIELLFGYRVYKAEKCIKDKKHDKLL